MVVQPLATQVAPMRQHISFHNITEDSRPGLRQRFSRLTEKLGPLLERFQPDLVHLEGRIEKNPNHQLYRCSLRLKLGNGVLATSEEGHDLPAVMDEVFEELRRRLKKFNDRLRHAHLWKRPQRRGRLAEWLRTAPAGVREHEERALYWDLLVTHLDTLYAFVRRELTYLESSGELQPGTLQVGDLVDAVVLRGLQRFRERPGRLAFPHWLFQLAIKVTAEELAATSARAPDALSLYRRVTATRRPDMEEEALYEFWVPDEVLRIEDLVAAPEGASPEEVQARIELQRELHRQLALLPRAWRQAVVLTGTEGLTVAQAAEVLGRREEDLQAMLEHAHAFLRAKLSEAGFSAGDIGVSTAEYVLPATPAAMPQTMREELADLLAQGSPERQHA